ncbi:MAG TPA: NAD-dependent deacetylase [Planctomycetaceae bacterium]|nr:NAD-dependent deacetylase [Planctomycetaceae bacterium]
MAGADALLIGAGAGMGVDSGLPDFRGNEGFWKAYPVFRGRQFSEMSNPSWFQRDPQTAWGFFGHRFNLYNATTPHIGFSILDGLSKRFGGNTAIFTSNVDGQFQKSGIAADVILECHGSIHYLQCVDMCCDDIWDAGDLLLKVDGDIRAAEPLPRCSHCDSLARPNILMFGDYAWLSSRADEQMRRYQTWLAKNTEREIVAIEIGAGTAIPTVRLECEHQASRLIRINPRDSELGSHLSPESSVGIPLGAAEALTEIRKALEQLG